jgi:hypothetical protein
MRMTRTNGVQPRALSVERRRVPSRRAWTPGAARRCEPGRPTVTRSVGSAIHPDAAPGAAAADRQGAGAVMNATACPPLRRPWGGESARARANDTEDPRQSSPFVRPEPRGQWEWRTSVAYYGREWGMVLVSSIGLVRAGSEMGWRRTLYGACSSYAPTSSGRRTWTTTPTGPAGASSGLPARRGLLGRRAGHHHGRRDSRSRVASAPGAAAPGRRGCERDSVFEALVELYAFLYGYPPDDVRRAAERWADAMDVTDRWVEEGCDLNASARRGAQPAGPLLRGAAPRRSPGVAPRVTSTRPAAPKDPEAQGCGDDGTHAGSGGARSSATSWIVPDVNGLRDPQSLNSGASVARAPSVGSA